MHFKYICFFLLLLLTSCNTSRNLVYFDDLRETQTQIQNDIATRIVPNDLISINVSTLDPESNVLFNTGMLLPNNAIAAEKGKEGFLVTRDGFINFPVIGKIQLGGLTIEEATEKMTLLLSKHVKRPVVNVRLLNFRITVIGEVNNPSTFIVPTGTVTILEALGLAGGMTTFGKPDNLLLIRQSNGIRTTVRLNLDKKEILNSPYFYLQQNDVLYIEPHNKSKVAQTSTINWYIPIIVSAISAFGIYLNTVLR
jgi:polysaccharide biosynthesis/export protein